jgi:hypothetical protein
MTQRLKSMPQVGCFNVAQLFSMSNRERHGRTFGPNTSIGVTVYMMLAAKTKT